MRYTATSHLSQVRTDTKSSSSSPFRLRSDDVLASPVLCSPITTHMPSRTASWANLEHSFTCSHGGKRCEHHSAEEQGMARTRRANVTEQIERARTPCSPLHITIQVKINAVHLLCRQMTATSADYGHLIGVAC